VFFLTAKNGRYTLKFVEKMQEAKDTYSLWFEPSKRFDFVPGQFLEWTLPHPKNDSRGIRRFFSIASAPTDKRIRLVTKTNPKPSTFKKTLLAMKPGDELTVSSLEGEFTMPKHDKKLVFIAGGVGVTPFLSMVQYLIDKNLTRDIAMYYANKTVDEIGFKSLFEDAQRVGVKTIYVATENPPAGWTGQTGFITQEMIQTQTPDWKERTFYVSGPEAMVMAYEKMLTKMGLPRKQIKRDYFPGY
jgi:glycine betaine catabolism B